MTKKAVHVRTESFAADGICPSCILFDPGGTYMLSRDTIAVSPDFSREPIICWGRTATSPWAGHSVLFSSGGRPCAGGNPLLHHPCHPPVRAYLFRSGFSALLEMGLWEGDQRMRPGHWQRSGGSRCGKETSEGLLDMDLLRLALERKATAGSAVLLLGQLLETCGQNANASRLFDRRYEKLLPSGGPAGNLAYGDSRSPVGRTAHPRLGRLLQLLQPSGGL